MSVLKNIVITILNEIRTNVVVKKTNATFALKSNIIVEIIYNANDTISIVNITSDALYIIRSNFLMLIESILRLTLDNFIETIMSPTWDKICEKINNKYITVFTINGVVILPFRFSMINAKKEETAKINWNLIIIELEKIPRFKSLTVLKFKIKNIAKILTRNIEVYFHIINKESSVK